MPTLSPDQAPVNTPQVVSPQVRTSQLNTAQPAPASAAGAPAPGTAMNPGLAAGQPAPSQGASTPTTSPQSTGAAKTGLEGLTPHKTAQLSPERRKEIIGIIAKHAEHLPKNCSVQLVEKLIEKHAAKTLRGVTATVKAAKFRRALLKKAREKAAAGKSCPLTKQEKVRFAAKGKSPSVTVTSKKPVQVKAKILKKSSVIEKLANPRLMREVVKNSEDKQKAARLFARLAKVACVLKAKG